MPVAVVSKPDDGPRMAEALLEGGMNLLEITPVGQRVVDRGGFGAAS